VLSLGTLLKIGRVLNNDMPLESIEMAVLYTRLPEEYRDLILSPYLSIDTTKRVFPCGSSIHWKVCSAMRCWHACSTIWLTS
jgi:hypothetical protein